jgi:CBS domain-containing protein
MQIKDILREKGSKVVTIEPDRSVHDAICRLNQHGIGALIVMGESGRIDGIITERDILRECGERCVQFTASTGEGHSPCPALVKDAMTEDLVIGVSEDQLSYAMSVMTRNRIRHLPIVDDGRLTGIISIGDVVGAHVDQTDFENRMLRDYIQGGTY